MYSDSDFESFFIRYKAEAFPVGEFMQKFCFRNKIPYSLFEKCYKDTRHKVVSVQVQSAPPIVKTGTLNKEVSTTPNFLSGIRILLDIRYQFLLFHYWC
ncbi:hypothetical protein DWW10_17540 [Bacteroides intestinalis]|uniref:Uncharacterized protein n=1 Tax=Bacteroides intestinalis TaxID=329854 RepID=A0A412XZD9_9BACE|nr:hypothetical protein [Bacteroides intestinalis]RGV50576.1 hypothetical protein DWW10_17540 [Bacteroides intestinalis]